MLSSLKAFQKDPAPIQLVFSALFAIMACLVETRSQPIFSHFTLSLNPRGEGSSAIRLPFEGNDPSGRQEFWVEGDVDLKPISSSRFRIHPDDCLLDLEVNGQPIPRELLFPLSLCDWQNGFTIDLGKNLRAGKNTLRFSLKNKGGPYGLKLIPEVHPGVRALELIFLVLSGFFGALAIFPRTLFPKKSGLDHRISRALAFLGSALWAYFIFAGHPMENFIFSDMSGYFNRAYDLMAGKFHLGHLTQPLGVSVLAAASLKIFGTLFGLKVLYFIAGICSCAMAARAFHAWGGSSRLVVLAWGLLLFDLHLLQSAAFLLAEIPFAFFLSGSLLVFAHISRDPSPKRWFLAGALLGLAYLFKGHLFFLAPFLLLWLLRLRALRPAFALAAGVLIPVIFQAALVQRSYKKWSLSSDASVINWVEGKCPSKRNIDSRGIGFQSPLFYQLGENETRVWERPFLDHGFFWKEGGKCIQRHPLVLLESLRYPYYLFYGNHFWPALQGAFGEVSRAYAMMYGVFIVPGLLLGFVAILRSRFRDRDSLRGRMKPEELWALMAFSLLFCVWVFKSEMRYRVPFDLCLIPLSLWGWAVTYSARLQGNGGASSFDPAAPKARGARPRRRSRK